MSFYMVVFGGSDRFSNVAKSAGKTCGPSFYVRIVAVPLLAFLSVWGTTENINFFLSWSEFSQFLFFGTIAITRRRGRVCHNRWGFRGTRYKSLRVLTKFLPDSRSVL